MQSLYAAIQDEITDYYRLVAVLETKLCDSSGYNERLTLRKLFVWSQKPKERLLILNALLRAINGMHYANTTHRQLMRFE
jgi:hypothetical protein